jgi:DNA-binding beta-propeller fold protein YncE
MHGVSKVDPDTAATSNFTAGFSMPFGVLFDGSNIWVTDQGDNTIKKLNSSGTIIQTVNCGNGPQIPVFDGTNIWVPNSTDNSVTVVRASNGNIIATLTGNGLAGPGTAALDGQRVLVISGTRLSLWRATDLTPLGFAVSSINNQLGVCSDGINFWIAGGALTGKLLRF